MTTAHPRRTCPACARRYAGLVAPECSVCRGLGVLALGAAALHRHPAGAVARSVELYLEGTARKAAAELPYADRRPALEAAVDELVLAGILAGPQDHAGTPAHHPEPLDAASSSVLELDAISLTGTLGVTVTTTVLTALNAPRIPVDQARPANRVLATASANGDRTAIAQTADPIDPLGPDTSTIALEQRATDHAARVLALATDDLTRRRTRQATR